MAIKTVIEASNLRKTYGKTVAVDDVSGGQKQRLFIALALIHDPDLATMCAHCCGS